MHKVYVNRPDHFFYYNVKMTADFCGFPIETVVVDEETSNSKALLLLAVLGNTEDFSDEIIENVLRSSDGDSSQLSEEEMWITVMILSPQYQA